MWYASGARHGSTAAAPGCPRSGRRAPAPTRCRGPGPSCRGPGPTYAGFTMSRDFLRHLRAARRRVVVGEQLLREAVEVVDHARLRHRRDRRALDEPVRRHRTGSRAAAAAPRPGAPGPREVVELQRVHGRAMADEGGRHAGGGVHGVCCASSCNGRLCSSGAGGRPVTSRISCSSSVSRVEQRLAPARRAACDAARSSRLRLVVALVDDALHLGVDQRAPSPR